MIPELRIKEDNEILCVFCKRQTKDELKNIFNLRTEDSGVAHLRCLKKYFWTHDWVYRGFDNGRL